MIPFYFYNIYGAMEQHLDFKQLDTNTRFRGIKTGFHIQPRTMKLSFKSQAFKSYVIIYVALQ